MRYLERTGCNLWQRIHLNPTRNQINRLRRRQKCPILCRLRSQTLCQAIPFFRVLHCALEGLADFRGVLGEAGEVG